MRETTIKCDFCKVIVAEAVFIPVECKDNRYEVDACITCAGKIANVFFEMMPIQRRFEILNQMTTEGVT